MFYSSGGARRFHQEHSCVRAINTLPPWDSWARLARAALAPGPSVPPEQLLLVRDLAGNLARRFDPPAGVIPRLAAVLLLLYPDADDLRLPLTVRSDRLPSHRGEVSLPGGAIDLDDDGPIGAALREAHEELGVPPDAVRVWGTLSPLYISPSNFRITPVVGLIDPVPTLCPNDAEVSAVITVTVRELLDPALVVEEQWKLRGVEVRVPFFAIAGHKVWGATAIVLSEFVARMRRVRTSDT
jgi:8-oxo-dGTP pyrophosphatase MutT (NUDIX family)